MRTRSRSLTRPATLKTTILGPRRGFIAPDGTPDYPADSTYAHIANAGGLMTDGTDGWVIQ